MKFLSRAEAARAQTQIFRFLQREAFDLRSIPVIILSFDTNK
jgi:hypothetical protein